MCLSRFPPLAVAIKKVGTKILKHNGFQELRSAIAPKPLALLLCHCRRSQNKHGYNTHTKNNSKTVRTLLPVLVLSTSYFFVWAFSYFVNYTPPWSVLFRGLWIYTSTPPSIIGKHTDSLQRWLPEKQNKWRSCYGERTRLNEGAHLGQLLSKRNSTRSESSLPFLHLNCFCERQVSVYSHVLLRSSN